MSNLNEIIQPKRENATSIVGKLNNDIYFVDRSFQRKMIWAEHQKVKLIETMLMGYPMPEIYLWAQKADAKTGRQKFSVVDGQQRLTSIQQFINGEWKLKKASLNVKNRSESYAGQSWQELSVSLKQKIWEYNLNIREIPSSVTENTIHKIFVRLNQTDKSLNPQEMRNAQFHGEFINAAVDVADHLNSYEWSIFSDNDIRRMKDVDFSSHLLTYLLKGIVSTPAAALNELYDVYNDKYPARSKNLKTVKEILKKIDVLFKNKSVARFFSKSVHFYTIFVVLDLAKSKKLKVTASKLSKFVKAYTTYESDDIPDNRVLEEYMRGSRDATAGKTARTRRVEALIKYLDDQES